jgi:DNA-binding transcriptional MocR family regulator
MVQFHFKNVGTWLPRGMGSSRKYKEKIMKQKLVHAISSTAIVQEAVANFLKTGRYENHLRQFRRTLQINCQNYIRAIAEFFPEGTKSAGLKVDLPCG